MQDELTSRRQAAVMFQVEQLLKQSSSELTAEQIDDLQAVMDDVRHKLNTVSITHVFLFLLLSRLPSPYSHTGPC